MATRPPRKPRAPKAQKTLTQEMSALLAKTFLPDLRQRARQPAVERALRQRWQAERDRKRTAASFEEWTEATVEQVGAAWILSCVFVRVLEDRGFVDRRRIAGEGADDSLQQFLEIAPSLTERDYLLTVFRELATYPGAADVLDPAHNPAWRLSPSNDSIRALLGLLRETNADGKLRFGFEGSGSDTRFLGDLYQDLSESVRKRYALLQTPDFIERFILDQTLEPAIAEFGLGEVQIIDPTCGSGHFLLGAFHRLFEHRQRAAPGVDAREHAKAALVQVYGVDVNPYAVAIARFRLTLAYLEHAGIMRLAEAPRIETTLVVADSLLHGATQVRFAERSDDQAWVENDTFALDDPAGAKRVFGQRYHAVVGNPPYITCKDPVLREEYRQAYESAAGKYALSAPFTERFFLLAEVGGFVGMINANSFMKREFGKALIEKVLPRLELTEVVDTSGAYIPGHGTPTVLLFGRNRAGVSDKVRAVMGKRGEPATPENAEEGFVWSTVAAHHTDVGFENDYVSVAEVPRDTFNKHPWSLGGGGAAELKELLEERCDKRLRDLATSIGFMAIVGEDDVYVAPRGTHERWGLPARSLAIGESIRDWATNPQDEVLFPYNADWKATAEAPLVRRLWPFKALLSNRLMFGKTQTEAGHEWFEFRHVGREKLTPPVSIAFAEVATHNHFVLDRGGKVFKQTAPIIKLPATATEDDHLALLAYLNSSTACFWMKQVCFNKGNRGEGGGTTAEEWEKFYQFNATKLLEMPIPPATARRTALARLIEEATSQVTRSRPENALKRWDGSQTVSDLLADAQTSLALAEGQVRWLQEELDWLVYEELGLNGDSKVTVPKSLDAVPARQKGSRPSDRLFAEVVLAGGVGARFFSLCDLPAPQVVVSQASIPVEGLRTSTIAHSPQLAFIETPTYKRTFREGQRPWDDRGALLTMVLTEMERSIASADFRPTSLRGVWEVLRQTPLASQLLNALGVDDERALAEVVRAASVPFLPALRLSLSGIEKYGAWQRVWDQQHAEDEGVSGVTMAVLPQRYDAEDYQSSNVWRLRGRLDVPKERFISYPGCERDDDRSPLIGWAGWHHLQRAQALAALFQERKDQDAWPAERLVPILAGLLELVPWLKQWHNDPDPAYDGQCMGDVYEGFVSEKARELQVTLDDLRNWRPQKAAPRKRTPAKKTVTA